MTIPDGVTWEEVAFLPDCAFAALGDPRLVDDEAWISHPLPFLRVRRSGLGMLYARAECDGLPIEIGRLGGDAVAARLEFTSDVAALETSHEGRWASIGRLRLGDNGALALDKQQEHLDGRCHRVELAASWYSAEVFQTADDYLGIRICAEVRA